MKKRLDLPPSRGPEAARPRHGKGPWQADHWIHQIAEDLKAGKMKQLIGRLKRMRADTSQLQESLQALIRY